MVKYDIYTDISKRTGGDIYIGVVGPVRTGKSTFINKVMQNFVIPNISNKLQKQIALDEMPQSSNGKTIMTTQPMFVPSNAVKVTFNNKTSANIRLVDCVGYYVEGASGNMEEGKPRLVKTPWSDEEMPFSDAAKFGTDKVINEYSTIGVLITTDGSFTEIDRKYYEKAEEKIVREMQSINKPFIIIYNTNNVSSENTLNTVNDLERKYNVPVVAFDVEHLTSDDITSIFEKILLEFPMNGFNVEIPDYLSVMDRDNPFISEIIEDIKEKSTNVCKMKDYYYLNESFFDSENYEPIELKELCLSNGEANFKINGKKGLFYKVLSSICDEKIEDNFSLMSYIKDFSKGKKQYDKIKDALSEALDNGYGVVMPTPEEMNFEEPVLIKQGNKYGVKLKAKAPSLHIMKVDVATEVSPIVGNDKQGEEMANSIIEKYDNDPKKLWDTEMLGRSLQDLIADGINTKIKEIPESVQGKLRKTMCKIVNENKGGIVCILL